jgi:hypothetical protein
MVTTVSLAIYCNQIEGILLLSIHICKFIGNYVFSLRLWSIPDHTKLPYYNLAVNAIPLLANLYRETAMQYELPHVDPIIQQAPTAEPLTPILQGHLF